MSQKHVRLFLCLVALSLWLQPGCLLGQLPTIKKDIVYGHKDGMALTFDTFTPAKPNGACILFIQSGGWYSLWQPAEKLLPMSAPFVVEGFTVFVVRHGSAPKYAVPDAVADVRLCVRYIHQHAKELAIDPKRIGVFGGSAGGHLTLMLATTGDDGNPKAPDPTLRSASHIAAAVALFPPTDLRGWTTNPPEIIAKTPGLKPPLTFPTALEAACSPIVHVTSKTPPTLMIHGDKDELVPVSHSEKMEAALKQAGATSKLIVIPGAGHTFNDKQGLTSVLATIAWFKEHLAAAPVETK